MELKKQKERRAKKQRKKGNTEKTEGMSRRKNLRKKEVKMESK